MSSNMRIVKICEFCKKEYIARKTNSKSCSQDCARRLHRFNLKNDLLALTELKTEMQRNPGSFIKEDEIKAIQAKELLTLKEAALLLNVSPLTLRRWTLSGKMTSTKIGKKHIFRKASILL